MASGSDEDEFRRRHVGHVDGYLKDVCKYLTLYNGRMEKYRHIRVVFTGKDDVGKTTICRRLQEKTVNLGSRQPTVGAVLRPCCFSVDLDSGTWKYNDNRILSDVVKSRLGAVVFSPDEGSQTVLKEVAGESTERLQQLSIKQYCEEVDIIAKVDVSNSDEAFLSLWDMGGHRSFQASHSVFISSHGVYLLVFRLTDLLEEKLETVRLKKWIRMIGTFSAVELDAHKTRSHAPPIIFVGTFLDKLKEKSKDYDKQLRNIHLSISKFPELSAHRFVRFCTVDNSLDNKAEDLNLLRGYINEAAVHQDQWDRQLPVTWLRLEMDLLNARECGTRILTLAEVIEMNESSLVKLSGVDEIKLALEYLHCTRSVIYFREFDYIITDPQWLADFFSIFLTDDQFLPIGDLLMTRDLELYTTKGELTQKLIEGLLNLPKNRAFIPYQPVLLALMEKFGLIVKMVTSSGSATEHPQFSETYTIPSKLMELQNIDVITSEVTSLPSCLSDSVQAKRSNIETTNGDTTFLNRRPTARELGRLSYIVSASSYELLFLELGVIYPDIESMKADSSGLATVTLITKLFLQWTHIYPNQTFHHIVLAMTKHDMATDQIVETVEAELGPQGEVPREVSDRVPNDSEIQHIINNISNAFFNLCLEIGLSPPTIDQQIFCHSRNFKEMMTALFQCWKKTFQGEATIGRLLTAMRMCQMDWHTTAHIWNE